MSCGGSLCDRLGYCVNGLIPNDVLDAIDEIVEEAYATGVTDTLDTINVGDPGEQPGSPTEESTALMEAAINDFGLARMLDLIDAQSLQRDNDTLDRLGEVFARLDILEMKQDELVEQADSDALFLDAIDQKVAAVASRVEDLEPGTQYPVTGILDTNEQPCDCEVCAPACPCGNPDCIFNGIGIDFT